MGFGFDEYLQIADLAKSIKGKIIVSVNDIPEMREVFDGLVIESVDINYTVGGGSRKKAARELIIRNY